MIADSTQLCVGNQGWIMTEVGFIPLGELTGRTPSTTLSSLMKKIFIFGMLLLTLLWASFSFSEESKPNVGWWVVVKPGPWTAGPTLQEMRMAMGRLPLHILDTEEIKVLLKEHDASLRVMEKAGMCLQEGREQHLGVKLQEAVLQYKKAIEILEEGFVRTYDPRALAEPLLELGAALFQLDQKEEAKKAFMRVAALVPALDLSEGYFSPSIREAFHQSKTELGGLDPKVPDPKELQRIGLAVGLQVMVVVFPERFGDRPLLRLGVFDVARGTFCALETALLDAEGMVPQNAELADRLVRHVVAATGIQLVVDEPLLAQLEPKGAVGENPPVDTNQETKPKLTVYWWVGLAAAVLVGSAVALPLIFHKEVVDVRVHY
jgi:hypothetical protein